MYESYWQLHRKPFENSLDPGSFFFSETHHAALLKIQYAIENRRDAVALAGSAGIGKSLLVRALIRQLPASVSPVLDLVFPQMPTEQLINFIADELTQEFSEASYSVERNIRRLCKFFRENAAAQRHALLVVDESHLIRSAESLEALRTLLNLERASNPPFSLLLVGQPPLLSMLDRAPDLDERVDCRCVLRRFTGAETAAYIQYRLKLAGTEQPLFRPEAVEQIHRLSDGIPRRINRLCDLALVVGLAEALPNIGPEQILSVQDELVANRAAA